MQKRIENVRKLMKIKETDYIIVSESASIKYLTNEDMESGERFNVFVIGREKCFWIRNRLFPLKYDTYEDISYLDGEDYMKLLSNEIKGNKTVGVDKFLYSKFLLEIMEKRGDLIYKNGSEIIDDVRQIKDEEEIRKMKESSRINDEAMKKIIKELKVGISEKEVAQKLYDIYLKLGADGYSFPPIVAFGKNGAKPHHETGDEKLSLNTTVLIDIGCMKDGYASDMTRTYFFGEPTKEMEKVHSIVKEASEKATQKVRAGVKLSEIDKTARNIIENAGYGKYFTHRLGHFIGLTTHESGEVSPYSEIIAKEGMIFSIEPGIYLQNKFGVRIENLVLVTKNGCEKLNKIPCDGYLNANSEK